MSDIDDDVDDGDRVSLYDETRNVKTNTQRWINQSKNMIKKFCKYERLPYSSIDDFPMTYNYQEFLGKFVNFLKFHCSVTKYGGILPSISGAYNLLLKHFENLARDNPTWRPRSLVKVYNKLRQDLEVYYWDLSNRSGIPGTDHAKCPNEKDMNFICEQLWLSGAIDAPITFAWTLNRQCGGRVNERLYLFNTSLFPVYTKGKGWHFITMRWLRQNNHVMSCLALIPFCYLQSIQCTVTKYSLLFLNYSRFYRDDYFYWKLKEIL
jgi:hypothetical protein